MIVVMLESDALQKTFETIIDSLRKVGETVELWWADRTIPLPTKTSELDDRLAYKVAEHQHYGSAAGRNMSYVRDLHLEAVAQYWHFHQRLAQAKRAADPITHLLVCNSAFLATRAALIAAERLGIPATCAEEGLFRHPDDSRMVIMSPGRSHFEILPPCIVEAWKHHETDDVRIDTFRAAWKKKKRVKFFVHDNRKKGLPMPNVWEDAPSPRIVFFGSTPYDAGRYWGHKGPIVEKLMQSGLQRHGAFYKGHPRVGDKHAPPGLRLLPSEANAHDIFPRTDVVVTVRSNAGIEAMLYEIPVVTHGRSCWSALAYPTIKEALDRDPHEWKERKRQWQQFLDFMIHEYHDQTNRWS